MSNFSLYGRQDNLAFYISDNTINFVDSQKINAIFQEIDKFSIGVKYEIIGLEFFVLRDFVATDEIILNQEASEIMIR